MKKFAKVLSVAASALVFAALVGCSDSPEIGSIQIANPVVKAESIFGANKITWADVDNADGYIVYRQLVTEEEVEVTTKKGTTTEIKEVLSELKAISTVTATRSSEDYKVIDLVSSSALLKEGAKIRYTVEAYNNGTVDSRAISKTDDMIDFARGKGTADVIIAEGNMPAKGTQLAAPTTAEVTVTTRASNGAAIVEVSPDAIDNDETVRTVLRYESTGIGLNDEWYAFECGGWWTNSEIEIPGLYDVYIYNTWTPEDNTYYDDSEFVLAKEQIEVKAKTSDAYNTPYLSINNTNKELVLSFSADKVLTSANPTFSISKYVVTEQTYPNASGYGTYKRYSIREKVGTISVSASNKTVDTDGTSDYKVYDKDVKVLPDGQEYLYVLVAKAGDWIGREYETITYADNAYATWSSNTPTISSDYDYLEEDVLDADGTKIGTKYTNKANYYINGTVTLAKGESLKLAVAKYSKPTGYSAETALELTQAVTETTSSGGSKVSFTAINKDVARLNSENSEFYEYRLYKTDKNGLISIYSWTTNSWDEKTNSLNYVLVSVKPTVTTKDSITIPVSITYVAQNASVETAIVRVVCKYENKDYTITTKVLDTTGFVEDTIKGTSKEKEIKIEGLPADTTVNYSVFAVDANGVMVYSATSSTIKTLAE